MEVDIPITHHCELCQSDQGVIVSFCECKETLYHEDCLNRYIKMNGSTECTNCKAKYNTQFRIDLKEFLLSYRFNRRWVLQSDLADNSCEIEDMIEKMDQNPQPYSPPPQPSFSDLINEFLLDKQRRFWALFSFLMIFGFLSVTIALGMNQEKH